jgi:hypothetical protein
MRINVGNGCWCLDEVPSLGLGTEPTPQEAVLHQAVSTNNAPRVMATHVLYMACRQIRF